MHKGGCVQSSFTRDELERIEYSKRCLWYEFSKVMILCVIFGIFEYEKAFIGVLTSFAAIRVWMGGIHKETYMGCLLDSFLWLMSGVVIAEILTDQEALVVGIGSILVLCLLNPVQSTKKKKMTMEMQKRRKIKGILLAIFLFVISRCSFFPHNIQMAIVSGEVIETLQVTIKNLERRKRDV